MQLTHEDALEAERELCRRKGGLAYFTKRAWPHIIPDDYQHNWHIDALCEHFEAVHTGEINRLLINVPPGSSKSTISGIMFPAWVWGPGGYPGFRYIGAAHDQGLAIRDARLMRNLISSEWYRRLWPVNLAGDQNEKLYFENDKHGFRQACAVASMTGRRGHCIGWDDALNPEKANSETERDKTIRILRETLPTRLNNPKTSSIVIIMQRLHENDPSGYVLANDLGYEHLCIPMEYEPSRAKTTSIGWSDPRTEQDELMFPDRFPREVIDRDKAAMGSYAVAGQFQQLPAPRGGGLFKIAQISTLDQRPKVKNLVRRWDLASTEGAGDWSAGVLMGEREDGGGYVILDVQRFRKGPAGVREHILTTAESDSRKTKLYIPQDPGQAGKVQKDDLARAFAQFAPKFERESGDKLTRAEPFAAQVEVGRVSIVKAAWNDDYLGELASFPNGSHDDQVDGSSGAFNSIVSGGSWIYG